MYSAINTKARLLLYYLQLSNYGENRKRYYQKTQQESQLASCRAVFFHLHAHHIVVCVHTMPSCVCTPCHHVRHTTPLCACTPCHHVHAHHAVMCMHTTLCTPHRGVHFSQISLQSHVTTHLSPSEGSILSNLSDLVRNCEISPKIFPPFKEQSCYNSSAKKKKTYIPKQQQQKQEEKQ